MSHGFCCFQVCVTEVYDKVCLPGESGSWGLVEVPGSDCHSGTEVEGKGQDPLLEVEAALEATETGREEHGEENHQV